MQSQRVHCLVGPTAVGKSSVAHRLALKREVPILSADSMLVYKGMDIGTAKPTLTERGEVPYFGIDLETPDEPFSIARWLNALPPQLPDGTIVAGGTGFYVKTLLLGLDDNRPPANPELRAELDDATVEELQARLRDADPAWLDAVKDPKNPRRLIRALEAALNGAAPPDPNQPATGRPRVVGLWMEPERLAERIAARVDTMFESGLLDEVRTLNKNLTRGWSQTASYAIGYREVLSIINGEMKPDDARKRIATRTRQLAKRQRTWFSNQFDTHWVHVQPEETTDEIAPRVEAAWDLLGPQEIHLDPV